MEEIIAKVSELYLKYGIKSVTMDDVSRELGISKKTLYQHFKDKDDLVKKVVVYQMSFLAAQMEKLSDNKMNAIEELFCVSKFISKYLKQINPSVSYDLQKYYPQVWKDINMDRRGHIFNRIKENMQKGIKEGLYRDNINIDIIARFYLFRIELSQTFDLLVDSQYTFEEIFNTSFYYHIRGIANQKGLEYLEKNSIS